MIDGGPSSFFSRISRKRLLAGGSLALAAMLSACNLTTPQAAQSSQPAASGTPVAAPGVGGKLDQVLKRGKVIVGTDSATPPFCFKDKDGNWVGFDIEFAKEIARGLFDKPDLIEFVDEQPSSRIPNLQADKVDFVIQAMTITAPRAQLVNFTVPYYRDAVNLVLPKNSKYTSFKDMQDSGIKVAILQNRDADNTVHNVMPNAQVIQIETQAASVLAVEAGRADAAMVEHPMAMYMAAQNPDKFKAGKDSFTPNNFGIAVRANDWPWIYWLNTTVNDLVSGLYYAQFAPIYKKWFGEDPTYPVSGSPI